MKGKPVLSVIVPVYNSRDTLLLCVESILRQSLKSMEIILVNDGSTDGGGEFCDELKKKYENVTVVHQENKGPFSARIVGCEKAKGKYISFVDSDDWLEEEMFEKLLKEMSDADMLAAGIIRTGIDGSITEYTLNQYPAGEYNLSDISFVENMLFRRNYTSGPGYGAILSGPWSKIFKRDLVLKISTKSDVHIREGEDWLFNSLYMIQCKKIIISDSCYYHYVANQKSSGHSTNPNYLRQQNDLYDIMKKAVDNHPYKDVLLIQIQRALMANLIHAGMKLGFNEEALIPTYHYLNTKILNNKKIVLFGAGMVGKNYFIDLHRRGINVVLWIDNCRRDVKQFGVSTVAPNEIKKVKYDYVICAIRGNEAAKKMRKQLIELGVDGKKILWEDPIYTISEFFSTKHDGCSKIGL